MFEKIGPNHVRSSWGFEVSVRRHATQIYVEYREDDHVVHFDNTTNAVLLGYPEFTFRPKHITRWSPPFENEVMGKEKRKQVVENMAAALDYLGVTSDALDEQANRIGGFGPKGWVWKDEKWLSE